MKSILLVLCLVGTCCTTRTAATPTVTPQVEESIEVVLELGEDNNKKVLPEPTRTTFYKNALDQEIPISITRCFEKAIVEYTPEKIHKDKILQDKILKTCVITLKILEDSGLEPARSKIASLILQNNPIEILFCVEQKGLKEGKGDESFKSLIEQCVGGEYGIL